MKPEDLNQATVPAPAFDPELWPEEAPRPRKRRIDAEGCLQKHIMQFVREELPGSEFFSFDRSAAYGQWSHARQKARGVRRGTPDTLLRVKGSRNIWCELKAPGNKPDDAQVAIGRRLLAVGDVWFWVNSVIAYANEIAPYLDLRPGWAFRAADHDARVQGEIERAMMKAGKLPKRLQKRATPPRIRRAHAAGVWKAP